MTHALKTAVREVADGVYAYLQEGSWGFSNAGLVTQSGSSLLVDTLYDLKLTARMLGALAHGTPAKKIDVLVNTHANGDHCWGNQLVKSARMISSRRAADEMRELSPRLMASLVQGSRAVVKGGKPVQRLLSLLGRIGVPRVAALADAAEFVSHAFGPFEFEGVSLQVPTETFSGTLDVEIGGKRVSLLEVGPAHTKGDVLVYLPRERVVFTGDILFVGSHPVMWEGPVENWIAACDRLLALDVDVIVPGHGPITDKRGVQETKDYWSMLLEASKAGLRAGASADEIARDLHVRGHHGWNEASRLAVNVDTICRDLSGDRSHRDPLVLLAKMGRLERGA
jgi:glyoxylase-like metal-dependent hydrolase (beta-lactamase superfamily II)